MKLKIAPGKDCFVNNLKAIYQIVNLLARLKC